MRSDVPDVDTQHVLLFEDQGVLGVYFAQGFQHFFRESVPVSAVGEQGMLKIVVQFQGTP